MLITGSIWAKASWGHWWVWDEPTLVSFLIVFLLYATYQPLRFSIEDPERQARYASVFAITAGAFVPLNFLAVRLAQAYTHPRVFATTDGGLPAKMQLPFYLVRCSGWRCSSSRCGATRWPPSTPRRSCARCGASSAATTPSRRTGAPPRPASGRCSSTDALPDNTGYVAAAYLVFFALVLIYVVIMAVQAGALRARAGRAQRAGRRAQPRSASASR